MPLKQASVSAASGDIFWRVRLSGVISVERADSLAVFVPRLTRGAERLFLLLALDRKVILRESQEEWMEQARQDAREAKRQETTPSQNITHLMEQNWSELCQAFALAYDGSGSEPPLLMKGNPDALRAPEVYGYRLGPQVQIETDAIEDALQILRRYPSPSLLPEEQRRAKSRTGRLLQEALQVNPHTLVPYLRSDMTPWLSVLRGELREKQQQVREWLRRAPDVWEPGTVLAIPARRTFPLIARNDELRWLEQRLSEGQRFITLVGPGGIGKTRLAREIVERVRARREGGRPLGGNKHSLLEGTTVALAPLVSAAPFRSALAAALGCDESTIESEIDRRAPLVLLDNLEHLLSGDIKEQITTLVGATTRGAFLLTSQRRLNVSEEQELIIAPLTLPEESDRTAQQINASSSVHLLEMLLLAGQADIKLRDTRRDFRMGERSADFFRDLCRFSGGSPLALQLIAPRVLEHPNWKVAVASLRENLLTALARTDRDGDPRHQAMQSTLEWSAAMLSAAERRTLLCLSVFHGSFADEDAESIVTPFLPESGSAWQHCRDALLNCYLLLPDTTARGQARFYLLEPVRAYVRQQAEKEMAASDYEQLAGRFAMHYAQQSCQRLPPEDTPATAPVTAEALREHLDAIERDLPHLRAALPDLPVSARQRLLCSLLWFSLLRPVYMQGIIALAEAELHHSEKDTPSYDASLLGAWTAGLLRGMGRPIGAQHWAQQACDNASAHGWPLLEARALRVLAMLQTYEREYDNANRLFDRGLALLRAQDSPLDIAQCYHARAEVPLVQYQNDPVRLAEALPVGLTYWDEAIRLWRHYGQTERLAISLAASAVWLNRLPGRELEARARLEEALRINRIIGLPAREVICLRARAVLDSHEARWQDGIRNVREALTKFHQIAHSDLEEGVIYYTLAALEGGASQAAEGNEAGTFARRAVGHFARALVVLHRAKNPSHLLTALRYLYQYDVLDAPVKDVAEIDARRRLHEAAQTALALLAQSPFPDALSDALDALSAAAKPLMRVEKT